MKLFRLVFSWIVLVSFCSINLSFAMMEGGGKSKNASKNARRREKERRVKQQAEQERAEEKAARAPKTKAERQKELEPSYQAVKFLNEGNYPKAVEKLEEGKKTNPD